jgi:hypothetical protein
VRQAGLAAQRERAVAGAITGGAHYSAGATGSGSCTGSTGSTGSTGCTASGGRRGTLSALTRWISAAADARGEQSGYRLA